MTDMSDTQYSPLLETTKTLFTWLTIAWLAGISLFYVYLYVNDPRARQDLGLAIPNNVQNWIGSEFRLKPCSSNYGCDSSKDAPEAKLVIYSILLAPPAGLYALFSLFAYFSRKRSDYKEGEKILNTISEYNYLEAYKEIESNNIQSSELWAKAFALSEGDEAKQQSIYVELRARQLGGM
jgi:hypothetical protein